MKRPFGPLLSSMPRADVPAVPGGIGFPPFWLCRRSWQRASVHVGLPTGRACLALPLEAPRPSPAGPTGTLHGLVSQIAIAAENCPIWPGSNYPGGGLGHVRSGDEETLSKSSANSARTALQVPGSGMAVTAMVTWLAPTLRSMPVSVGAVSAVWSPIAATALSLVSCRPAARTARSSPTRSRGALATTNA